MSDDIFPVDDPDNFLEALEITHDLLGQALDPTKNYSKEDLLAHIQFTCGNLSCIIDRIGDLIKEMHEEDLQILAEMQDENVTIH